MLPDPRWIVPCLLGLALGCQPRKHADPRRTDASADASGNLADGSETDQKGDLDAAPMADRADEEPAALAPDGGTDAGGDRVGPLTLARFLTELGDLTCALERCYPNVSLDNFRHIGCQKLLQPQGALVRAAESGTLRFRPEAGQACLDLLRRDCSVVQLLPDACQPHLWFEPTVPLGGRCTVRQFCMTGVCPQYSFTDCAVGVCDSNLGCAGKCVPLASTGSCAAGSWVCDAKVSFCHPTLKQCFKRFSQDFPCQPFTDVVLSERPNGCLDGLACLPTDAERTRHTCQVLKRLGERCEDTDQCQTNLSCTGQVCRLPGAPGAECDFRMVDSSRQCQAGNCIVVASDKPGVCGGHGQVGAPCGGPEDCAHPLTCLHENNPNWGTCGALRKLGESCRAANECARDGGRPTMCLQFRCAPLPTSGAPCSASVPDWCPAGTYCPSQTEVCTPVPGEGQECAFGVSQCAVGLYCDQSRRCARPPAALCRDGCPAGQTCGANFLCTACPS